MAIGSRQVCTSNSTTHKYVQTCMHSLNQIYTNTPIISSMHFPRVPLLSGTMHSLSWSMAWCAILVKPDWDVHFRTWYICTGGYASGMSAGHARHGLHVVACLCLYLSRWYPSHLRHRPVVFLRSPFIEHTHEDIRPYLYVYALCCNVDTCLAYEHTHAHADIWKDKYGQFPNWRSKNRICTDSEL